MTSRSRIARPNILDACKARRDAMGSLLGPSSRSVLSRSGIDSSGDDFFKRHLIPGKICHISNFAAEILAMAIQSGDGLKAKVLVSFGGEPPYDRV